MNIVSELQNLYDKRGDEIEQWFSDKRKEAAPFFYSSVDLRHSGRRLIPVDTNLYPAGFNNLSVAARARAARIAGNYLREIVPDAKQIAIIPENHTRNLAYLENLATLRDILIQSGYDVLIANITSSEPLELTTSSGNIIRQIPLAETESADLYILNNDLTAGIPAEILNIRKPILPPPEMGWHQRRKSIHFAEYKKLAEEFARLFNIDSWRICANFHHCGMVDFKDRSGLECVAKAVDELIAKTKIKYAEYAIDDEPYIFMKADSGTYGMGIMTLQNGKEVLEMNKKERNKMHVIKEGARVSEVILQEGIPTIDKVSGKPAEPMIYMIDGLPVGGMYRINGQRDSKNNLNAAGMEFVGMCDEIETADCDYKSVKDCDFRAYGIIAAIAALAASQEKYHNTKL